MAWANVCPKVARFSFGLWVLGLVFGFRFRVQLQAQGLGSGFRDLGVPLRITSLQPGWVDVHMPESPYLPHLTHCWSGMYACMSI